MNEYGSLLIGFGFATAAFVSSLIHIRYEKAKRAGGSASYYPQRPANASGAATEKQVRTFEEVRLGNASSRASEGGTTLSQRSEADAKHMPTQP